MIKNSSINFFPAGRQSPLIDIGEGDIRSQSTATKASKLVLGFSIYQMQHIAEFFSLNDVLKLKSISVFSKERNNINLLNFSLNYIEFIETSSKIEFSTLLGLLDRENIKSRINEIDLGNCFEIRDDDLMVMPNYFSNLRGAFLHQCIGITNAGFKHLASNYPDLQKVDLSRCSGITDKDAALKDLADSCPKLHAIALMGTGVTDAGLSYLASRCPDLTFICLAECWNITDSGIRDLASSCRKLQRIDLEECKGVTDVSLRYLATACQELQYINLGSCKEVTDVGLKDLSSSCQKLKHIDVSRSEKLTDSAISYLALGCPHLENISISNSENFTDVGLKTLASNCKKLLAITLNHCEKITNSGIKELVLHCPSLQIIYLDEERCLGDGALFRPSSEPRLDDELKKLNPNLAVIAY